MTYPPWLMTIVLMVTVKGTMVVKHISNKSFPTLQTLHHSMGRRSRTSEAKSKRRHPYISASSSRTVSSRWQHIFLIHFLYISYIFLTYFLHISYIFLISFLYISYLVLIYFSYISHLFHIQGGFYRTQVSLGSDLWVRLSLTDSLSLRPL